MFRREFFLTLLSILLPLLGGCLGSGLNPPQGFNVTASGTRVTISPASVSVVPAGTTHAFTVTADPGYITSTSVAGTCPAGTWSGAIYTTGNITANCSLSFSATLAYSVTPSGDSHVTISPNSAQLISYGSTQAFTVTANTGYTVSASVGGSCPAGSWTATTYTTGAVTSNCTVVFSTIINTYSVTPSGDLHETITPNSMQTVNYRSTQAFTVTANIGYTVSPTVGGSCPTGSWSGATYTTGAVTSNCTVTFSGVINTSSVTPSGDGNVNISPNTPQTVNYGST